MLLNLKAKFNTKESQKQYFCKVKKKLSISVRKLAALLGVSRGALENYCSGKTAPPHWVVEKLENLTNIRDNYTVIGGRVVRNKRKLMPMNLNEAKEVIDKYFPNRFNQILNMLKEGGTLAGAITTLRNEHFTFDNSPVARALGTCKRNLLIGLCDNIPTDSCVVVKGKVEKGRGDCSINFNLQPLADLVKNNGEIRARIEVSEDRKSIKLLPLKIGRKISFNEGWGRLKVCVPNQLDFSLGSYVDVIIPAKEFGINFLDCIFDADAVKLAKKAVERKINIFPVRSTPNNRLGDLVFEVNDRIVIIEITRACSRSCAHFKIGQVLMQKISHKEKKPAQFLVCREKLFNEKEKDALRYLNVSLVYTDFKENWENDVLDNLSPFLCKSNNY